MSSPNPEKPPESPSSDSKKRPASPLPEDEPSKLSKPAPTSELLKSTHSKEESITVGVAGDFTETTEMRDLRVKLEHALTRLGQDTRNSLLLQAVHHYTEVKKLRDDLLVQVGELDAPFADLILRKAREEGGKPDE